MRPIYKSGDPAEPSNFRPILIVPVIYKITERIVQRQLYCYHSSNCLLSYTQHVFVKSTRLRQHWLAFQMLPVIGILATMDKKEISLLCLKDLSTCFDVISHSKLLGLQLLGIDAGWVRSYLGGHTQSVCVIDGEGRRVFSKSLPNNVGVFQGSALGPLLFSVYANDLSLHAPDARIVQQYADDAHVLISGRKSELEATVARLSVILSCLSDWFTASGLKVNAGKTQLMILGSRQNLRDLPDVAVRFRDAVLEPCHQVKNLGMGGGS